MRKKSKPQFDNLDDMLAAAEQVETGGELMFEICDLAQWPDEDKPKLEEKYRRACPVHHERCRWVVLGNGEAWLFPELAILGKDVQVETERRGLWGKVYRFTAAYKHHKLVRDLFAKVIAVLEQDDSGGIKIQVPWQDAYMLMYMALKVNYRIPDQVVNELGLLREEHFWPIFSVLGGFKKKDSGAALNVPVPLTGSN